MINPMQFGVRPNRLGHSLVLHVYKKYIPKLRLYTLFLVALVCTSCTRGVQEIGAICLVVLETAEIPGLIICFAIHFLCVTIE